MNRPGRSCRRAARALDRWLDRRPDGVPPTAEEMRRLDAHLTACPTCAEGLGERLVLQQALERLARRASPPEAALRRTRRVADLLARETGRRPLEPWPAADADRRPQDAEDRDDGEGRRR